MSNGKKKIPSRLAREIELAEEKVRHFESRGLKDTIWHTTLERLLAAKIKFETPSIKEIDDGIEMVEGSTIQD